MRRSLVALSALCVALSGCTGAKPPATPSAAVPGPAPAFKLVAFDSCEELLKSLRGAAADVVGPWGFAKGGGMLRGG
jgi:hypothetical protein